MLLRKSRKLLGMQKKGLLCFSMCAFIAVEVDALFPYDIALTWQAMDVPTI